MFTLYSSDFINSPGNCSYPHKTEVMDATDLAAAVSRDYVCAEYMNGYRNSENFIGADCLPVDCDNDHSENPADWVTPADVQNAFPGITFAVHYSRYHMREKNGRTARPKFHVLFPIEYMTDATAYSEMKKLVNTIFPYFDTKALDAARFFFGTADPQVEIFPGEMTLSEYLSGDEFDADMSQGTHGGTQVISEGSRNATMSRFAGRVIKKYGDSEEAFNCFMEEAEKCTPPLEHSELMTIWHSAQKFYAKVQQQEGYIPPEQYNQGFSLHPADFSDIGQAKVLAKEYAGGMVYTDATDYMCYDGTHWSESKQLAVGACENFLDRQLAEAILAVDKAKQALMDSGIGLDIISSGGKALEKAIDARSEKAFAEYCAAMAYPTATINPLGDWTGGTDVDTGATNRKLGSDMADSVTGGGLHGKDLSKADVSVNIYAWLKAQLTGKPVELCCAIGDETVDGIPYSEIVETARNYIKSVGGFERFAEWGLV